MNTMIFTVVILSGLGVLAALILYFVMQKFRVEEDPRIDEVEKMLPGANCGGCGFAGCRGFASSLVAEDDISELYCPVGGGDVMGSIATYLGKAAAEKIPMSATLKCGGCLAVRRKTNNYDGAQSCAVASSLYIGESGCVSGCLGLGDCVKSCKFGALSVNEQTGLVEVDVEKCTACGACVKACPKSLIELRKRFPKDKAIYVACSSTQKGAQVMKACKSGCIGCGKCVKECPFGAIEIKNNLAYIDSMKCKLCRKCVAACPTKAIKLVNMEPLKPKPVAPKVEAAAAAAKPAATAPKAETTTAATPKAETATATALKAEAAAATAPKAEAATATAPKAEAATAATPKAETAAATAPKAEAATAATPKAEAAAATAPKAETATAATPKAEAAATPKATEATQNKEA
ncbi:MAG: RnfABCDGE type electron transport complex subunit B [Rikenellaceae bacterium]